MNETLSTEHTPTIEATQADHDALVDMLPTLTPEETDTFNELVDQNRTATQQAKELGALAFNQLPEMARDDFEDHLTANKQSLLESDAIFYGNTVKRK